MTPCDHSTSLFRVCLSGSLILLAAVLFGLMQGSGGVEEFTKAFFADAPDPISRSIILSIRLPRILVCGISGAILASSGLIFQTVMRNDLAEPYILGISGGSAVGYVAALLLETPLLFCTASAFTGGILSAAAVLRLGTRHDANGLLLSGVMLNALFGALILFLVSSLAPDKISTVFYWYMGNPGLADLKTAAVFSMLALPLIASLFIFTHPLDVLLLEDDVVRSLGIDTARLRTVLIMTASLAVSLTVAAAGPIGFVGLVVPQIVRLLFCSEHRVLLPGCILFGSSFLIFCDTLARSITQSGEMPTGVITSLIGAVSFIFLLSQRANGDRL